MLGGKIFENYKLSELKIRNNYEIKMKRNLRLDRCNTFLHLPVSTYSTPTPTTDDTDSIKIL